MKMSGMILNNVRGCMNVVGIGGVILWRLFFGYMSY